MNNQDLIQANHDAALVATAIIQACLLWLAIIALAVLMARTGHWSALCRFCARQWHAIGLLWTRTRRIRAKERAVRRAERDRCRDVFLRVLNRPKTAVMREVGLGADVGREAA